MAHAPLVISVTSGKGGVGKTNLCVNLACELARRGKKVVLLDADLGLANVDVVLGLTPAKNLFHLFHAGAKLADILCPTPYGFSILPAASGVTEMLALDTGQKLELLEALDPLDAQTDVLLVDTGAGIGDNVAYFNIAAQERILVLTPEPTSLTDAYALIKVLKNDHGVDRFKVLVNLAPDRAAAREVFKRLHAACDHFLSGVSLDLLGFIPRDPEVRAAVVEQKPFVRRLPDSPAAKALAEAAGRVAGLAPAQKLDGNIKFFWKKLLFQE
jgi:flagellar biosynthesis protein FlhG